MKITIIGGCWAVDTSDARSSGVVAKIADSFNEQTITNNPCNVMNGGFLYDLPGHVDGLTIWMPYIPNSEKKAYPRKDVGSCLIVSKVIREIPGEHDYFQPVNRIFKMGANAVIAIRAHENQSAIDNMFGRRYSFALIDALGNVWVETDDVALLTATITQFYEWNKQQQRSSIPHNDNLKKFLRIVRRNAKQIVAGTEDRYFGNCSTRCMATFPSMRVSNTFLVSPRNLRKDTIVPDDMILIDGEGFHGDKKPSVDSPVQIALYAHFKKVNYMIHGHAFFEDAVTTHYYYPCGDLREVPELIEWIHEDASVFVINLKNHGFLIGADTLDNLENILKYGPPKMQPFRKLDITHRA